MAPVSRCLERCSLPSSRIAVISEDELSGERVIDVAGLVVAPGFIDMHEHGQTDEAYGLMVRDGVTAALELEVGTGNVAEWYAARDGGQIVNYGVSIGHIPVRMIVMEDGGEFLPSGAANSQAADPAQIDEMARRIGEGLAQGAVAVGFGIAYTPAASVGRYRAQGGGVIIHSRTEEMTLAAISNPLTMIAIPSEGIGVRAGQRRRGGRPRRARRRRTAGQGGAVRWLVESVAVMSAVVWVREAPCLLPGS